MDFSNFFRDVEKLTGATPLTFNYSLEQLAGDNCLTFIRNFIPSDKVVLPENRSETWYDYRYRFLMLSPEYSSTLSIDETELNNLNEKELQLVWQTTEMLARKKIQEKMKLQKLNNTGYQLLRDCLKAMESVQPVPFENFRERIVNYYTEVLPSAEKYLEKLNMKIIITPAELDLKLKEYKTMQEIHLKFKEMLLNLLRAKRSENEEKPAAAETTASVVFDD